MKKYILGICALVLAIGFSAFTAPKFALVSFHFIPANGSELTFENGGSWELGATNPECVNPQTDVCILRIDDSKLAPYSGTQPQQLAAYLADQGVGSADYANASVAAAALTILRKP